MHAASITTLFAIAAIAPFVDAHGRLMIPAPTFVDQYGDPTKFCGTIDGPKMWPQGSFATSPQDNTNSFLPLFHANYGSLKEFLDKNDGCGECGITKWGAAKSLPADGVVVWANGDEGWVSSHEGPCEMWCDDVKVHYDDNCSRNNPGGKTKIDLSKCAGAKKFITLWIALHAPQWQSYKNCVALQDGVAPSPPSPSTSPSSPTPSSPTLTPYTEYPAPTPPPHSPTTSTPSTKPTKMPAVSTPTPYTQPP
ncbi:hypothetical protein As57867_022191, partial [Aphanomyces stellatus]